MQVIFIRHATAEREDAAGDEGRKLTKEGTQQCKHLAVALKAMQMDVRKVLTSPLLRAAETAAIIAHELGGLGLYAFVEEDPGPARPTYAAPSVSTARC